MHITRKIQEKIENSLFQERVIVLYGARRVGKTTLLKDILQKYPENAIYLNCDEPDIREKLTDKTSTQLKDFISDKKLVLIDEAQRVSNIGLSLKLLIDNYPEIQIIASGSSSFELSNKIFEPLTGRKIEFKLYPFSLEELISVYSKMEIERMLEKFLLFGTYPNSVLVGEAEASKIMSEISESYLYKDALEYQNIRKPEALQKLLQALALQIGQEVSYSELGSLLSIDKITLEKYIDLLEKAFVIFKLPPLSRNLRKEIGKMRKIYFYDLGIRNSLIRNFNPLSIRTDTWAMWENFLIVERMKRNDNSEKKVNSYFWRTYDQKEIDYIEESSGTINGYEIKWGTDKLKDLTLFLKTYTNSKVELVNKNNFWEFIA